MRNQTRIAFNGYTAHIAQMNGVPSATEKFAVEPSIAQKLEDRIQENADFLGQINVVGVDEMSAEILYLGTGQPAASRTNTRGGGKRRPRAITNMDGRTYKCSKTDFDTFITYQQLDTWAKFPDFQIRLRDHVTRQIARDRLMIGWNGTHVAADTDLAANPLLQDCNIGWAQHIRDDAPQRVMSGIKVGTVAGSDYRNLDAMVTDANAELIDTWYREDTNVVAIVGSQLLNDKYLGLVNSEAADAPSEKLALATLLATKTLGNKRVIQVPFFPARSVLLTSPDNLSIYWQTGSHRRVVKDEPESDQIADYLSVNEAYVVEDLGRAALIENILLPDGAGGWH